MDTLPPASPPPLAPAGEDKTAAILSYLTVIGFIAAVIVHGNNKTRLAAFHLRQALGIYLTGVAVGIGGFVLAIIPIVGWLALLAVWISLGVLWVMGLIAAASGEAKPVPVLGELYQKWFGTAFD